MVELYPSWLRELWKEWDLRVMVLFSLTLQILLIFLGNRRKYSDKLWITIVVWSAYITADSVATFALGILSSNLIELYDKDHDVAGSSSSLDANTQLSAFWAPFLLLHLGGPDTITAYALEDNEFWLRHLLGLFVRTGMALSVFLMSWTASSLSILSLVMFLPGIIKYAERTWALRSSTRQKRRESRKPSNAVFSAIQEHIPKQMKSVEDALHFAGHSLFVSSQAFLDDIVDPGIRIYSFNTFKTMLLKYAFKVIEIELGMMYDLLYTKLPILFTGRGIVLWMITFFLTCSVMVLFPVLVDKHKYSKVDLSITYLLIIGAVIHEIYEALFLVLSDLFAAWLIEHGNYSIIKTVKCFPLLKRQPSSSTRRWSNKISQCSLLTFTSSKAKPKMSFKLLNKRIEIGKYWHCEVSKDLRELIFMYVKRKAEDAETSRVTSQWRPPFAELPSSRSIVQKLIKRVNFEHHVGFSRNEESQISIIVWHIATEVWYYLDQQQFQTDFHQNCRMIKRVSRYMMYLLVERPYMLSVEKSAYRFKSVWKTLLPSRADKITSNKTEACNSLLEMYPHTDTFCIKNFREELLIQMAMELVREVNDESHSQTQPLESKWKRIESAWMDMLGYAARNCKGNEHAQQLRHGGELLTHVWLLLHHLDLADPKHDEKIESDEEE